MKLTNGIMRSTAVAALLSVPFATGAFAQETNQTNQTNQANQSQQANQNAQQNAQGVSQQQDAVVATVGGTEILGSDLMTVIGALPPELQSQPPQMLVPMALEQLILRELVLEQARSQNLADDPEVIALVERTSAAAEDDAMVQVWLDRQLGSAVTDEAVQMTYDQAVAQGQQNLPPVAQVRPQIEQFLRQQAMQEIQTRLRQGADVVFFDPTGRPIEQQSQGAQASGNNNSGGNNSGGNNSGGNNSSGNSGSNNSGNNNSGNSNSGGNSSGNQSGDSGSSNSSGGQSGN